MWQFIGGFVVALLTVGPAVILLVRKRPSRNLQSNDAHLKEFEQLGRLTGYLAHEIKNPLSTIKVNLKLVSEDIEGINSGTAQLQAEQRLARARRKITVLQREVDRLEQILDDFLRYTDRTQLQLAAVDVNSLISDMVDFYSPRARSHSITVRMGLCSGPLICKIDADMLKQAILNLFINAQQAMSGGGELMIRTVGQKQYAVIQISDTGGGIEPDKLPEIFEVYYSSRPRGSGLGLPTAKRIIESHNGTVSVDSEPGKGTLFTIKLPLLPESEKVLIL